MGDKELEARGDGLKETYSIIAFPGASLPQEYRAMVFSKWMRSLKYGNEYFKLIHADSFFEAYQKYIELLLCRPGAVVRIAVLGADRDVALGWSVVEGSILHYVHVQYEQRNQGIGTALVPKGINTISHLTKTGLRLWPEKLPHASFNPFA